MNKNYLTHLFVSLIGLVLLSAQVNAEPSGPGWSNVTANPVSPATATAYFASQAAQPAVVTKSSASTPSATTSASALVAANSEISELARALQNDAVLMYEYVLNHIDYVPYYGSLKGATLTLLERSGNDFDQASLLIALFREAGFTASFLYGDITIPTSGAGDDRDMANWLGLDADANLVAQILANGGIPGTVNTSTTQVTRVWVQVTTPGGTFVLDPAFKTYDETVGINLNSAMGYNKTTLLAAAGGEVGTDYVRNLDDTGLQNQLVNYSTALGNYLKSNLPNAAMDEVVGGRRIRQQAVSSLPVSLPFSNNLLETWTDIPAQHVHTLRIQHGNIDQTLNMPDIAGKKLAVTYDTGASASSASTQSVFNGAQADVTEAKSGSATGIPASSTATSELTGISAPAAEPAGAPASQILVEVSGGTTTLVINSEELALGKESQFPTESLPTAQAASAGTTFDFGTVNQSQQNDLSITLNNNNSVTVTYTSSLTTNPEGAYSIIQNSVISIPPFSSDSVTIRLSGIGQARGTKTATWRYVASAPGFSDTTVDNPLTGFVAESPSVLSGSYGAGYQAYLNNPSDSTPRFNNSGNFSVDITSVTLTGTDASRFQIISGGTAGSVGSGTFRDISVRYLADVHGTHTANVTVFYNYDGINGYSLNLPLNAQTFFQPDQTGSLGINFGTNFLGSPIDGNALFKNNGVVDLTINSVTLTGADPNRFQLLSGTGAGTLTPGQTRTIGVRYLADVNASHTATVQVNFTYDGLTYNYTLPLLGQTVLAPDFTGSSGVNFGQHYLNDTEDGIAVLKNSGSLSLTIDSITLTGVDSARFSILSGGGAGSLATGATRNIDVRYLADVTGIHAASVTVNYTYDGFSNAINLTLSGETLPTPPAQLWLDDVLLVEELTAGSSGDFIITVDHPYAADGGTYADASDTYSLKRGSSTYVLLSDIGGSSQGLLLKQRQQQLEQFRADGFADASREVLTESLMVMGQTWMRQTTLSDQLLAKIGDVIHVFHHRFGMMAQETGYFIDIKTQKGYTQTRRTAFDNSDAHFKAAGFLTSALEHGVLEQLQGSSYPAASTIKLINLANTNSDKIFLADATNYTSIEPQLSNYSAADLATFQSLVNDPVQPAILILPENGQIALLQWQGKGYVSYSQSGSGDTTIGMIIGGDYFGGYSAVQAILDTVSVYNEFYLENYSPSEIQTNAVADPVDITTGAFLLDQQDLSLGAAEPWGLSFSRSYSSDNHLQSSPIGQGWSHNYDVQLSIHSDVAAGLGLRAPIDAVAGLVASVVTLDLMGGTPPAKDWTTSALTNQWVMNELFENAVSTQLQNKGLTYIKLPDGSYNPPPGVTTNLVKSAGLFSLQERFGTEIQFNANDRISNWVDIDGNSLGFTYSGDDLQTVTDTVGRTLTFAYTSDKLSSVTDSTGRAIGLTYTGDDLTQVLDAEGKPWAYSYDSNHRMLTKTDPRGVDAVINRYDTLGRMQEQDIPLQGGGIGTNKFYLSDFRNVEEDPAGNQTLYFFDAQHRIVALEDALGNSATQSHDGQNHVVASTDPRNNQTLYTYDGNQNFSKVTNALLEETNNTYDVQQRLTDVDDALNHNTHFDYDAQHHLTQTTDAASNTTQASYNPLGQTASTNDGRVTVTTLTYDPSGNPATRKTAAHPQVTTIYDIRSQLQSLTDQEGATTSFLYDDRGLVTKITDPLLRDVNLIYDDAGLLSSRTDRNTDSISYSYTPAGNPDTITYPDTSSVSFSYDNRDRLTGMSDPLGASSYTYDALNRLTSQTDPNNFTVGYGYDAAGNLTSMTYPGNNTVNYSYDALNRIKTVTTWLGNTATYNYDAAGRLTAVAQLNGSTAQYGHDNADRLTSLVNKKSDTTVLSSHSYTLDGNGNRTQEVREEPQLPINLAVSTTSYTYNSQRNRLLNTTTDTFTYDNEGQQTDKSGTGYGYDYEHRLTSAGTDQYQYDGVGNRLRATRGGTTTRYLYDASGNLLAEADNTGTITRYYIYGAALLGAIEGSNTYSYHFDGTGHTVAITDSSEEIINQYAYTPYGALTDEVESIVQPFKFVGQFGVVTELNGLYYMKARYYEPETKRFITSDPIGLAGGINHYAYVGGNPLNFVDPGGLDGVGVGGGFSLADVLAGNFAFGISAEVTTVLPLFSNGGGTAGLNVQYTPEDGFGLYAYYPENAESTGAAVGVAIQGNIATGRGPWSGNFISQEGNIGPISGGRFFSPGREWNGYSFGWGAGAPVGASETVTNYVPLLGGR